jgi:NADH:ubiquinone oxidoreductase subunit 3 (subunit A)
MWILAIILIVALLIPVAAILVDSPLGKSVARRMEGATNGAGPELRDVQRKVELLESEVEELNPRLE